MLRWAIAVILALHGLIHLMGFVKGFGLAPLSQLTQPISRSMGLLWLAAGALVLATAVTLVAAPRGTWLVGALALVLSQVVIVTAWKDAKVGTVANVLLLLVVVGRFASHGPPSLRAEYAGAVRERLAPAPDAAPGALAVVTEADLAPLPEPVRRYLRVTGAVGQPQVRNFHAIWTGRIRAAADDPWMDFTAQQVNGYEGLPSRLFFMDATMKGLPVDVLHRFVGDAATFRVRLLSLVPMVDAKGPEMNRSETVTVFNDLCLLAPSRLLDPSIRWEEVDAHAARGHFTRGRETVSAELRFDDAGELVDFISDDRSAASADGKTFTPQRWSTPLRDYRDFGGRRVATHGEARWEPASGAFTYGEFNLVEVRYDVEATDL